MLKRLNRLNQELNIYAADDRENVKKYGKKINYDFTREIEYVKRETKIPDEGNIYLPHLAGIEHEHISNNFYGTMPVQVGVCHGNNSMLNGLEWHKCSEIVVAITDLVLLVAHQNMMIEDTIDSKHVEGIYLEAGEAFEMYQNTMHFAPAKCNDDGFMSIIILPDGTNYDLKEQSDDKLLFKTNKWLIVHQEHKDRTGNNAEVGIYGENIELKY